MRARVSGSAGCSSVCHAPMTTMNSSRSLVTISAGLRLSMSLRLAVGMDGLDAPAKSVSCAARGRQHKQACWQASKRTWRQAQSTGPPVATQPEPVKACFTLSQAHDALLAGSIILHWLPASTSIGAVLMFLSHDTPGKAKGFAVWCRNAATPWHGSAWPRTWRA